MRSPHQRSREPGTVKAGHTDAHEGRGVGRLAVLLASTVAAAAMVLSASGSASSDAAIVIESAGHAWGWGLNGSGDLCLPNLVNTRPVQLPLTNVTLATGARTHALFDSDARTGSQPRLSRQIRALEQDLGTRC